MPVYRTIAPKDIVLTAVAEEQSYFEASIKIGKAPCAVEMQSPTCQVKRSADGAFVQLGGMDSEFLEWLAAVDEHLAIKSGVAVKGDSIAVLGHVRSSVACSPPVFVVPVSDVFAVYEGAVDDLNEVSEDALQQDEPVMAQVILQLIGARNMDGVLVPLWEARCVRIMPAPVPPATQESKKKKPRFE
jgi:hypothetical protein